MRRKNRVRGCGACAYYESCPERIEHVERCEYLDTDVDEYLDKQAKAMIERDRREYRAAWIEYVAQYSDGDGYTEGDAI